ncbi:MAG: prephenate dehydratase [Lentisphaerae bacterium]|nr:prephenate dehydratase [Lentisphaerota bacterium]
MNLDELRDRIDKLDRQLVELLNERTRVAIEIGRSKRETGGSIFAPDREKQVFERTQGCNEGPLPDESLQAIYREIMSASISLQQPLKIAFLGPPATFTHQAARQRFGASVKYLSCDTISDVFTWVEKGYADYGVAPIENSTEGAVTHTLDEFAETPLKIVAEIYLPIAQHLLSKSPKDQIRKIYSKPEVFGQCRRFLQSEMAGVDLIPVSSTARAAEIAASEPGGAALASVQAAETYGLDVISGEVQDMRGNTTRFLVVGRTCGKSTGYDRTSMLFAVQHRVGALHRALSAFSSNDVNLCKIESRPNRTKAWEYCFYVDVEGHAEDPAVRRAIDQLAPECAVLRVLGSYPRAHDRDE